MASDEKLQTFDTEVFLDEHLDPVVKELKERLGVTEVESLAICLFSLAGRINYEDDETPRRIEVQTDSEKGHLILSWFDTTQKAPNVMDYRASPIR